MKMHTGAAVAAAMAVAGVAGASQFMLRISGDLTGLSPSSIYQGSNQFQDGLPDRFVYEFAYDANTPATDVGLLGNPGTHAWYYVNEAGLGTGTLSLYQEINGVDEVLFEETFDGQGSAMGNPSTTDLVLQDGAFPFPGGGDGTDGVLLQSWDTYGPPDESRMWFRFLAADRGGDFGLVDNSGIDDLLNLDGFDLLNLDDGPGGDVFELAFGSQSFVEPGFYGNDWAFDESVMENLVIEVIPVTIVPIPPVYFIGPVGLGLAAIMRRRTMRG